MVTVFVLNPSKLAEPVQEGGQLVPETDHLTAGVTDRTEGAPGGHLDPVQAARKSPTPPPRHVLNIWGAGAASLDMQQLGSLVWQDQMGRRQQQQLQ